MRFKMSTELFQKVALGRQGDALVLTVDMEIPMISICYLDQSLHHSLLEMWPDSIQALILDSKNPAKSALDQILRDFQEHHRGKTLELRLLNPQNHDEIDPDRQIVFEIVQTN